MPVRSIVQRICGYISVYSHTLKLALTTISQVIGNVLLITTCPEANPVMWSCAQRWLLVGLGFASPGYR